MEFALTAEHEQIREAAYKFGQNVIVPSVGELDRQHTSDPETLKKLGEAGLLGLGIPAKWGGTDTDYISVGIACEELERADSTARVVMSVHVGLHCMTMMQWGTEEQCAKWLPDLATGKKIGAFGLTEPNAGSDAASMKTTARREGDEYVLNGEKTWISLADYADQFLVIARLAETDAKAPYAAFIVERDRPGFSSRAIKGKLGVRAGNTGQIFFDNVRIPASNMIGQEGDGFKVAMSALDHGRYTVAAGAVGIITACMDACCKYVNERSVQGEVIGKKQLVQQMIAKMARGRDIGRLLYYQVGWMKNTGKRHTREVSMAKWVNCEAAFEAANNAVEIHGAYGYCDEFPVERYFRNSRGAMIYEGTHEIHTIMQAEYALGYREDKPIARTLPTFPFA
ncbi:MAG TPA: acyl-CoA dehydrogenase family protein [Fimbriimonadaceae bacterium]|nr:butyryl-CoA dehydrogenase [Armatimonadota bacterium]HRD30296.1 acyl-CoA dehydrogenase family protein [Fimbriimonadaceae bacterium]HRE94026.1 acyl-CoA dehydrogenase family protein [Fimbriimonadaceae bacterium]HRI73464.1 acyl-CoA dehydrogenase family protein [Fimbriimonadaceae bacterium]